jgi:hypothetical protein
VKFLWCGLCNTKLRHRMMDLELAKQALDVNYSPTASNAQRHDALVWLQQLQQRTSPPDQLRLVHALISDAANPACYRHYALMLCKDLVVNGWSAGGVEFQNVLKSFALELIMSSAAASVESPIVAEMLISFAVEICKRTIPSGWPQIMELFQFIGSVSSDSTDVQHKQHFLICSVFLRFMEQCADFENSNLPRDRVSEVVKFLNEVACHLIPNILSCIKVCSQEAFLRSFTAQKIVLLEIELMTGMLKWFVKCSDLKILLDMKVRIAEEISVMLISFFELSLKMEDYSAIICSSCAGLIEALREFSFKSVATLEDKKYISSWIVQVYSSFVNLSRFFGTFVCPDSSEEITIVFSNTVELFLEIFRNKSSIFRKQTPISPQWKPGFLSALLSFLKSNQVSVCSCGSFLIQHLLRIEKDTEKDTKKDFFETLTLESFGSPESFLSFCDSNAFALEVFAAASKRLFDGKELLEDEDLASEYGTVVNVMGDLIKLVVDLNPQACLQQCLEMMERYSPESLVANRFSELKEAVVTMRVCSLACSSEVVIELMRNALKATVDTSYLDALFVKLCSYSNLIREGMQVENLREDCGDLANEQLSALTKFKLLFSKFPELLVSQALQMIEWCEITSNLSATHPKLILSSKSAAKNLIKLSMEEGNLKLLAMQAQNFVSRLSCLIDPKWNSGISTSLIEFCCRVICAVEDRERQIHCFSELLETFIPCWDVMEVKQLVNDSSLFQQSLFADSLEIVIADGLFSADIRLLLRSLMNFSTMIVQVLMNPSIPRNNPRDLLDVCSQGVIMNIFPHVMSLISRSGEVLKVIDMSETWASFSQKEALAESALDPSGKRGFQEQSLKLRWLLHIRKRALEFISYSLNDRFLFQTLLNTRDIADEFVGVLFSDLERCHPYLLVSLLSDVMPSLCQNCPQTGLPTFLKPVLCAFLTAVIQNLHINWEFNHENAFMINVLDDCAKELANLVTLLVPILSKSQEKNEDVNRPPALLQMVVFHQDLLSIVTLICVQLMQRPNHAVMTKATGVLSKLIQILSRTSLAAELASGVFRECVTHLSSLPKQHEKESVKKIAQLGHDSLSKCAEFPEAFLLEFAAQEDVLSFKKGFKVDNKNHTCNFLQGRILGSRSTLGNSLASRDQASDKNIHALTPVFKKLKNTQDFFDSLDSDTTLCNLFQ